MFEIFQENDLVCFQFPHNAFNLVCLNRFSRVLLESHSAKVISLYT